MEGATSAHPLLKFWKDKACLAPDGFEAVQALPGHIFPIIFVGDGRGGKSYLASRVVGLEDAFESCDSAEPVTQGIDMWAGPITQLFPKGSNRVAKQGDSVMILDCEGGNNAMAAIRTLVNVFGLLLGTQVVFVANGMASEQALQTLCTSLAARSLIRLDGDNKLPVQQLTFVVNKNSLRYEDSALDKILEQKYDDAGRQELRDTVRAYFPERRFCTIPLMGSPNFEESVEALRSGILEASRPLTLGGVPVDGKRLAGMMELIVSEMQTSNEVSLPSMSRFVVFDGFLAPTVQSLSEEARCHLPRLTVHNTNLEEQNPHTSVLQRFAEQTAHIAHKALVDEARAALSEKLKTMWQEVSLTNVALGEKTREHSTETREVPLERTKAVIGGRGLLKGVTVVKITMKVESRSVLHKMNGSMEFSQWTETIGKVTRYHESAFESLSQLPVLKAIFTKKSPNRMRALIARRHQERECVLKDGHFLWWETDSGSTETKRGEAKGCINFLVHHAKVEADPSSASVFLIKPADPEGWSQTTSFTGDEQRTFYFDIQGTEAETPRDEWVEAIQKHIEFGRLVVEQLGAEKVSRQVKVYRPAWADVEL